MKKLLCLAVLPPLAFGCGSNDPARPPVQMTAMQEPEPSEPEPPEEMTPPAMEPMLPPAGGEDLSPGLGLDTPMPMMPGVEPPVEPPALARVCDGELPLLPALPAVDAAARDVVHGDLIQFNDNGTWSWYQDERALMDAERERLVIGSAASATGVGGGPREAQVEAVFFELESGRSQRFSFQRMAYADDHDAPAFVALPNGNYVSTYAGHNDDNFTRWRVFDGTGWSNERLFDWRNIPGGTDYTTTYANLFFLSAEQRVYNVARTFARSPNFMVSEDFGESWQYGGLLTLPDESVGYVNGYFKYDTNGVDRIDFVATEHHPRDFNTSIFHGYVQGGQSFNSAGEVLDETISDKSAPRVEDYTLVFAAGEDREGVTMTRAWTIDMHRFDDGTIAALFKTRANDDEEDHRFFYARFDGTSWSSTYLGRAGGKLYESEQDYTGLGAIHPNDSRIIYISSTRDPRDDADLGVHEIFRGVTCDGGASFAWTPVTQNSVRDNLRPIVPKWSADDTALLWWRGTYLTAQSFDAAVVGMIERPSETHSALTYVDATAANTNLGAATGPAEGGGAADNQWHQRTGFGNGDFVITSAETNGENAPALTTTLTLAEPGTYDVWVNFWANPEADWRIVAGLDNESTQVFRQMASQQVRADEYTNGVTVTGGGNTFLYRAYVGRVTAEAENASIQVRVDDQAVPVGVANGAIGDTARTWYDGVSYARVTRP